MKKIILMLAVIALLGFFAADSYAQRTPHGKKRMTRQKTRITNGVKSGSLTRKETARLTKERRKVKSDVKTAKSDGKLTVKERRKLRGEMNRSSRNVYRAKHNNKTRKRP